MEKKGRRNPRAVYFTLACATIAIGLLVHRGMLPSGAVAKDVLGDALWAAMMLWWVSLLAPDAQLVARAAAAYGICAFVEMSQMYHAPMLDALRRTTVGHLVLGSGFDPRDMASYALGVATAMIIARSVAPKSTGA